MKLKVKNLNWIAGRPVVFLNEKKAKEMNIFANDRVSLTNSKRVYAVVDIFSDVVKENEVGLSKELSNILKISSGSNVEVKSSEISDSSYLVKKKMEGKDLNEEEISFIISEIVHNNLTEAEIAYFTAAEKINGMSLKETVALTKAMIKTGAQLEFQGKLIADKHCIGGIAGNRTTPILVAICAVAGLILPKTSSRAITSASGTADVMETMAKVDLSLSQLKHVVNKAGACLAWGGSLGLAPSDDKIIKVERILNLDIHSQMIASIISKKVSAGSKYLLIDIPYGDGAKVVNLHSAKWLGDKFKQISKEFNIKVKIVYTKNDQPIGNGFGPVLEMLDVLAVLKNSPGAPKDLRDKSLYLSKELMSMCGIKNARKKAEDILNSGKAYEKFREIVNLQNGKKNFDEMERKLTPARFSKTIYAEKKGLIIRLGNKRFNSLCRVLGTPETKTAGVYLYRHLGPVKKGEPLITLYSESKTKIKDAEKFIKHFNPVKIK